ncbi:sporulation protein [Methanosarcina sp. 2.H.T.1A.6]|uniref:GerW family sporulation protein n=1 Tax=unclassified Methanosarcina TaxID=2644672 RepID=UPI0006224079|nr:MULTISPECIES: GerW family sporulation protein [unclassified Methanosarcina]KKG16193.1 sporulation protein [Methanosarcina sp. 2.H.T.1A.3]KKG23087.1 sporulation protein [Methanosarcina sp. 2.H.T.1A.6]KKG26310.1 sporulation protein [Methanosarcina sp. 2.H.T.1A.8]KKG26827.1 sporulation protein [Methanosarcina sp. 2.H.T.1A.15]
MGVEDTIKEIAGELEKIATTKTVVGDPITAAGKTIIPVSKLTMGFGAGGGEGKKDNESGYGGGGGAGAKIEPVAFIMLSEDDAKIFRISEKSDVGSILNSLQEVVPDILEKIKGKTGKHKKEEGSEGGKTEVKEHTEFEEKGGVFQ